MHMYILEFRERVKPYSTKDSTILNKTIMTMGVFRSCHKVKKWIKSKDGQGWKDEFKMDQHMWVVMESDLNKGESWWCRAYDLDGYKTTNLSL